ncbi:MAG: hypothetical protein HDR03_04680 [Lachnospiraceae bacterium]|nr:hypothetical protein [Lachnospiraceae bacterium]
MKSDISWKAYFSDDERYADIINGIAFGGVQEVSGDNIYEADSQSGFLSMASFMKRKGDYNESLFMRKLKEGRRTRRIKVRDTVRKVAFGVNFVIIGIENQGITDYSMPLRNLSYDTGEYEKQAAKIRREVRRGIKGNTHIKARPGEYLYGFLKKSRLKPVVTFILYSGIEEWDGPQSLHDMIDFTDIPETLRNMVSDYRINLIEIRKLKDTSMFKTDVRQVFDFIRLSEDKTALVKLVENDDYYKNMEEDAFEVAAHYTNAQELIETGDNYSGKDGKIDMCRAIKELIADGKAEGKAEGMVEGITQGIYAVITICRELNCSDEIIRKKLMDNFTLTEEEAGKYLK